MNKNISVWRGSNTPPTKYHLWLKDDNKLYKHIQDNLWKSLSDNSGVTIVSSIDELDPNAQQGSLASVAVNTISEVPFSELYQPTSDEVNMEAGVVDTTNLSRVSGISINSSYDTSAEIQESGFYLFSKDIDMQGGVGQILILGLNQEGLGVAMTLNFATYEQQELVLFTSNEDGIITVNEENLAIINNLLSSTEFVYGVVFGTYYADMFYKAIGGISKTDLYIKKVEGWKVVGDGELKEQIDDLKTSVENLEGKTDLIVNSVDELPQHAQTGTLASVLEEYPVRTEVSSFSNVADKERIVGVNIVTTKGHLTTTLELVSKNGTESIFLNTVVESHNVLRFSYTEGENTTSLGYYNYLDIPQIPNIYSKSLQVLNEKLKNNEFIYVKSTDDSEKYSWFVPTILKEYKKTILYTKNEFGWEQCVVGGPYNSTEGLSQNAPLGSLARVIALKPSAIPVSEDFAPNKTVKEFVWNIPEKLSKEFLNSYTTNGGTILKFKETSLVDSIEFTNYLGYPSLIYSYYPSSPKVIAKYDTEGNLISKDLSGTEYINSVTKTYTTSSRNPARFDIFLSVPKTEKSTYLYVKNETGWEQYSELVDQSVTTEKVADKAITMTKLAEDVQEAITDGKVLVVGSIDELDLNAEQGSLAVFAGDVEISHMVSIKESYIGNENPRIITELNVHEPTGEVVESEGFAPLFIPKGYTPEQALSEGRLIALYTLPDALAYEFANGDVDAGDGLLWETGVGVSNDNVKNINDLIDTFGGVVYAGNFYPDSVSFLEPTEQSISSLDAFLSYDEIQTINETTLYIKEAQGWEEFKTGSEVVNNLEEGGVDKALSAEMGKFLNEKIANIVAGNTTEPIKFKGYVNVDNKNGIDTMFGLLSEGEACLVAPSVDTGNGDSYKTWVSSAINQEHIELGAELFKTTHNITVSNVLSGKPLEVKTFLKLDEAQPYCQCPDMILLCKIKVKAKDFVEFVDGISSSIASVIPDSLMLTACIGKVLRWSGGDWVAENQSLLERGIVKNYPYRHKIDMALETGVISYTDNQEGSAIGVGGWYTVFVNASADVDSGGVYVVSQTAYGRNGEAANRVFTRLLFVNKAGTITNKTSWVEITKGANILPNVNGWLLNPDDCLETGVYQTCNSGALNGIFTNNYFTMFVNASTSPNGDGYDAIEQTAYGRDADGGKIYRRVIFYHKANNIKQYGVWVDISGGSSDIQKSPIYGNLDIATDTFGLFDDIVNLTPVGFVGIYSSNDNSIDEVALSITLEGSIVIKTTDYIYGFAKNEDGEWVLGMKKPNYSERFVTEERVEEMIEDAVIESGGSGSSIGSSAYDEVNHGTSDTTFTLTPNTFHVWESVPNLTITLSKETTGVANEYLFQFTSGEEPTTLSLPDSIKWTEDFSIEANKIYQISILKGLGNVLSWNN